MRKSGILLHIASLPNDYGIGSMGREAYDFVDYLKNLAEHMADTAAFPDQLRRFPVPELLNIRREPLFHQP